MTLALPLVREQPASAPNKILLSPEEFEYPALYPIATLKHVSASEAFPAPVPEYKFSCESGANPERPDKLEPSP